MTITKRKVFYWLLSISLFPIILTILLGLALYIPAVQRWAVSIVEREASEAIGKDVQIGELRLSFPIDLTADSIYVLNAPQDTLASLESISLRVSPSALLDRMAVVPRLALKGLQYNQQDSTELTSLRLRLTEGVVEHASLAWEHNRLRVTSLYTDGLSVYYHSADTTTSDSSPLMWLIEVETADIRNSSIDVGLPSDSLFLKAIVPSLSAHSVYADLGTKLYQAKVAKLSDAALDYDNGRNTPLTDGYISYDHISAKHLTAQVERLKSHGSNLSLQLSNFAAIERSGLLVKELKAYCQMDSLNLKLSDLQLRTDASSIAGEVDFPLSIMKGDTTSIAKLSIDASIGFRDVSRIVGSNLPEDTKAILSSSTTAKWISQTPIQLTVRAEGSLREMSLSRASLLWQQVLDVSLQGNLYSLHDNTRRRGRLTLAGSTYTHMAQLVDLFVPKLSSSVRIPAGLTLSGNVDLMRGHLLSDLRLKCGNEHLSAKMLYNEATKSYKAKLSLDDIDVSTYMPTLGIGLVGAEADIEGRGYDFFSSSTSANVRGSIHYLSYQQLNLRDITFSGSLRRGELDFSVNSFNKGLDFSLMLDAIISRKQLQSAVVFSANDINLSALGIAPLLTDVKLNLEGELRSDLKDMHSFQASARGMQFSWDGELISPNEVDMLIKTSERESTASLASGDLKLALKLGDAPRNLLARAEVLSKLTERWWQDMIKAKPMPLTLEQLSAQLPTTDLDVEMGTDNALRAYLIKSRLSLEALSGHIRLRPNYGIDGHILARDLRQDTLRINCIDLSLSTKRIPRSLSIKGKEQPDSLRFISELRIDKTRFRQQRGFNLSLSLNASLQDATLSLLHKGEGGTIENQLKLLADWTKEAYRVELPDSTLVLAGTQLKINDGNWFNLNKLNYFFSSNISLSDGKRSLLSFIADHKESKEQEAVLSIQNLALQDYRSLGLPDISGTLSGDINYYRAGSIKEQPVISGDLGIQELSYEKKQLGYFALAIFYQPRQDGAHDLTAEVSYKGKQSLSINGVYSPKAKDPLRANLSLKDFPLEIVNPFTAPYSTLLAGTVSGSLAMGGTLSAPQISGALQARGGKIELQDFATTLRLDSLPLAMQGDRLTFDNYALYSEVDNTHPIYLNGYITTHGPSMLSSNLRIRAEEVKLMEQMRPKVESQMVYGRLITSADIRLSGILSSPRVRGQVNVLSGTSCTYLMQESLLDTSDKSVGLVAFKDFADTLFLDKEIVTTRELGGIDMSLGIHIDPTVRLDVHLSADGRDHLDMQGGGNMQFRYPPYGEMSLIGRYEMSGGGTFQYTLPVVGSKQFAIDPSGYIAFDGKISNPMIDFIATQKVRASAGDASSGKTTFNVSIKAKNRIDNINLSFDLSAPENLAIQNRLVAMSSDERSKQAIGLLATGTYLGGSNSNNLNLNETFSTLIQNQINTVAGSLLNGTDLSLGMNLNDNEIGGANQTSYTYSFSRRFYNDRIRVVIGGKIQTGNNPQANSQQFIDNVSLEYQMDKAGERFLQVYHKRITDNVIEGEYSETGAGVLLRRKLTKLSDLFRFGKKKTSQPDSLPPDSSRTKPFTFPQD